MDRLGSGTDAYRYLPQTAGQAGDLSPGVILDCVIRESVQDPYS
jgi:hypothetical protein